MDFEEIKELIHGRGMEGGGEPLHIINSPPYIREGEGNPSIPLHIINSSPYIREGNGGGRGTPPFMGGELRGRII